MVTDPTSKWGITVAIIGFVVMLIGVTNSQVDFHVDTLTRTTKVLVGLGVVVVLIGAGMIVYASL